ncbi:hypothetical protein GJ496_007290, partial [Pomphorhynchus laevis]
TINAAVIWDRYEYKSEGLRQLETANYEETTLDAMEMAFSEMKDLINLFIFKILQATDLEVLLKNGLITEDNVRQMLTVILATKINYWSTSHHIGQEARGGYLKKVLVQYNINNFRPLHMLEETAITRVLTGGVPDTQRVQNELTSEWQVSPELAGRLSGLLRSSKIVYDNTAVYTIRWILYWQIDLARRIRREPIWRAREWTQDCIVFRDIRNRQAEDAYLNFAQDLTDSRIVTAKVRSSGRLRENNRQRPDYNPVIRFAVYGVGERVLPAPRIPVASAMRKALIRLATNRNEMSQLVNGFVRAATICFGWAMVRMNNGLVVTSLFEYGVISLPTLGDSNWIGGL